MKRLHLAGIATVALTLSSCTTTQQVADSAFSPPQGGYRVIVMQPDISVGVLTAGGGIEHREDWTNQARLNVTIRDRLHSSRSAAANTTLIARTREQAGGDASSAAVGAHLAAPCCRPRHQGPHSIRRSRCQPRKTSSTGPWARWRSHTGARRTTTMRSFCTLRIRSPRAGASRCRRSACSAADSASA